MENQVQETPQKDSTKDLLKVRGTATFFSDNTFEFVAQKEGKPKQTEQKNYGDARTYLTTGQNPKRVITVECPADATDPVAHLTSSIEKVFKGEFNARLPDQLTPKGVVLKNEEGLRMTINKTQKRIEVSFSVSLTPHGKRDYKDMFYEKITQISKCFAINESLIKKSK